MRNLKKLFAPFMLLGLLFTSCGKTTPTPEPEPPVVTYTAESVASDFNKNIVDAGLGEYIDPAALDQYGEYSTFAVIDESTDESEASLGQAAAILASFLPEYMEASEAVYGDPTAEGYIDLFGDGSYYYYLETVTPDESVYAAVVSYVYSSYLVAQIAIGDIAAEE